MRVHAVVVAAALLATGCTSGLSLTLTAAAGEPVTPSELGDAVAVEAGAPTTTTATTTISSTSTTTSTTTTTPPPEPIVLGFAGDVNMIRGIESQHPLDAVSDLLSAPDLMMVNLESVVGEPDEVGTPPIAKEFIFLSPPAIIDQLLEAGVDVVGLANNHAWDYGPRGAVTTAGRVADSALLGAGAGADPEAAYEPVFVDVGDRTVGIASVTRVPCDWSNDPGAERPEVAWACDRFALPTFHTFSEILEGSDVAVVLLHGSVELAPCPSARTREVITSWIGMGIDVVAVSHPHVLGGIERIGDGVVLWSTGNFAFVNGGGSTARSAVFEVTVDADHHVDVRIRPTVLPGAVAAPADDEAAALIRDEVSTRSPGGRVDDSGRFVPDPAASTCDVG